MNSKRVYFAMIGVVVLLGLLAIGTTVFGNSLLQKEAAKLVEVKLENEVLEAEQNALILAKNDLKKYETLHDIARQIVPSDKDQAKTTREIIKIADAAGVRISSIGFPSSKLGEKATGPAPAAGSAPATNNSITQAVPAKGIPGLLQLDINVISDTKNPATYGQLIDFLKRLENNRRTSHVTSLSIQPNAVNNNLVSFVLIVTVYIKQ
jgi:hypothetical protein